MSKSDGGLNYGFELLQVEQSTDCFHETRFAGERGWFQHIQDAASRALADKIIKECAIYRRFEPKRGEPPYIRHRWTVAVGRNKDSALKLEQQLEAARRQGMRDAAEIVMRRHNAFIPHLTGTASLIQGVLLDTVRDIEDAAQSDDDR